MLTRIKEMYYQEALTLLRWLAYARSPPTLGELVDAAITDPLEESFVDISERGGLRDALNILSGLVTIEENQVANTKNYIRARFSTCTSAAGDGHGGIMFHSQHLSTGTKVRLAHFSVKEYLESKRILKSSAHQFYLESATGQRALSQGCLTYLRYYSVSPEKTLTKQDLETFPLLEYAAQSWFHHCALQHDAETSREVSFLQTGQVKSDWLLVHDPDTFRGWGEQPFSTCRIKAAVLGSAIYYASLLRLSAVVSSLLASGADVNAEGGCYGSAVQAAAAGGHTEIVRLLVDNGADVNNQSGEYGNALQAASTGGHTETVRLLVDNGADVNAQSGYHGSAVQAAAAGGHTVIVRLLVDNGADVNAQSEEYDNALQAASMGGHTETVQLLVDSGADINAQGGFYGSAVQAAAAEGHTETALLLRSYGALEISTNGKDRIPYRIRTMHSMVME
jgi:hypothetical protein